MPWGTNVEEVANTSRRREYATSRQTLWESLRLRRARPRVGDIAPVVQKLSEACPYIELVKGASEVRVLHGFVLPHQLDLYHAPRRRVTVATSTIALPLCCWVKPQTSHVELLAECLQGVIRPADREGHLEATSSNTTFSTTTTTHTHPHITTHPSCSLDMPEDATWYSGSLSNLCRECPD